MGKRKDNPERREWYRQQVETQMDYNTAPRMAPAYELLWDSVEETRWDGWAELREMLAERSDLAISTVDNMIRSCVNAGYLQVRGKYNRSTRVDNRDVRVIEWPENWR